MAPGWLRHRSERRFVVGQLDTAWAARIPPLFGMMGAMSRVVGRVAELWCYPVKSLGGQQLSEVRCGSRGFDGDRLWAVRGADGKFGSGKTTRWFRRMPGLLSMASLVDDYGDAWIRFADGESRRVDDPMTTALIGAVVGEDITLVKEGVTSHFDDAPLHLVSTASLRWLEERRPIDQVDRRRFRPNLVVEREGSDLAEDGWLGRRLQIGDVTVKVEKRTERCVMTTLAQDDLRFAPAILGDLHKANESCLGVYARVVSEGTIRLGDDVVLCC
jgi:uncharacterized protein YcbX